MAERSYSNKARDRLADIDLGNQLKQNGRKKEERKLKEMIESKSNTS